MPSTVYVQPQESIAANYDNVMALALVTALSANDVSFVEVVSLAGFRRGQLVVPPGTGVHKFAGFEGTSWVSSFLTLKQWKYLKSNYEGEVTIRTLLDDDDTYYNCNAVLYIGELVEYRDRIFRDGQRGKGIQNFEWRFSRLVIIPDP